MFTGELLDSLRGHFDNVSGCQYRRQGELLTAGEDRQILSWVPELDERRRIGVLDAGRAERLDAVANNAVAAAALDQDEWSSDLEWE